jgi:hypothetical protein
MALKAVKPEIVEASKPKMLVSGRSGVGKSMFSLKFPNPYLIDTEGGAIRSQYKETLIGSGGAYFGKEQGSQNFEDVINEIKELATTKHNYKTLIIDSFSHLYNMAASIAEEKMGNEFGRDKKEANRPSRQLLRWLENLDMTTILICHSRDKWERRGRDIINTGTTFDGFDKLEYILDLWLEVEKTGDERSFVVRKSRISSFVEGKSLPLDYKVFSDIYGREIIQKPVTPVEMASDEETSEIVKLLEIVKIDPALPEKWLEKAGVESWSEMKKDQAQKVIEFLKKKLEVK